MNVASVLVYIALPLAMGSLIYGPTGNVSYFLLCWASFLVSLIIISIYLDVKNEEDKKKYGRRASGTGFAKAIIEGYMTMGAISSLVVFVICMIIGLLAHKK